MRLVSLLGAIALALAGCRAESASPAPPPPAASVRLTSGIPGATFHPLGVGLARRYERALAPMRVELQESPGSVRNVQSLQRGTADIGFAFADVTYVAYVGRLAEDPTPFGRLRGMAVLQLNPLHVLVRPGLSMGGIADLRGRRVGIPPDELSRVELRFVRGRRAARAGSGLGLAIASRIVRDHGGTFAIESAVGRGTTVLLRLPMSEV